MSAALLAEARRRLDAGDPASALRFAQRALESSRSAGSDPSHAAAAHLVGECLYVTGDVNGARERALEALELSESRGDPAAVGADLNLMGVLEVTEGRPDDAIGLLRRSLALREEALGPEHPDTIESLNNLAVALWRTGAEEQAVAMHEDALGRCERALGEDHRRTAETLDLLAESLLHEETVYPATVPAARFMRRLGDDERVPGRDRLLELLTFGAQVARDGSEPLHAELARVLEDLPDRA